MQGVDAVNNGVDADKNAGRPISFPFELLALMQQIRATCSLHAIDGIYIGEDGVG
jgi:hypothetical protein